MLRVADNPYPRFPVGRPLEEDIGRWWVARVKPRNEKILAKEIARLGIGYYLPMFTKRTIRKDNGKPRKSLLCLFPGYISITDYDTKKDAIFRTGRIINVIRIIDQEKFVRELENIRLALEHTDEIETHPYLVPGERVIIVDGPMKGIEGVIADVRQPDKIFLNIEFFQRSVSVKVSPEQIMPVEDRLLINNTNSAKTALSV